MSVFRGGFSGCGFLFYAFTVDWMGFPTGSRNLGVPTPAEYFQVRFLQIAEFVLDLIKGYLTVSKDGQTARYMTGQISVTGKSHSKTAGTGILQRVD